MRKLFRSLPLLAAALMVLGAFPNCGEDGGGVKPPAPEGTEPSTYFAKGPADSASVSYRILLGWGATIEEGSIDHYEISWETPDNWQRVDVPESVFTTSTSNCCDEALPEFAQAVGDTVFPDSTYSEFHTLYVRAVSAGGKTDATPVALNFLSKTAAPLGAIITGINQSEFRSCPDVDVEWEATDIDGEVASYEYAMTSFDEYEAATGAPPASLDDVIDWLHTNPSQVAWQSTTETTATFLSLPPTQGGPNQHVFAVRAIDTNGAREQVLDAGDNVRSFGVRNYQENPLLTIRARNANSQQIGFWRSDLTIDPLVINETQRIRFTFQGDPQPFCRTISGFSHRGPEDTQFTAFDPAGTDFPFQDGGLFELWDPPASGNYTLAVRVRDIRGFQTEMTIPIQVDPAP